jgi:glycosyltransferase involved in cell wall biosynthesis
MSFNPSSVLNQLPSNEVVFWVEKTKSKCLIIPVINEGDRIINVINKLNELLVHEILDIIIVDGGSTDGSLEINFLKENRIKALILKTGMGRLSAQLRIGYYFALKNNYDGILTIDGNGKDDPSSLPLFVNKLNEGYDFVQASRFILGGVAKNTPFLRYFAVKYVHAPVLSLFSGFKWTDTTQGYRAYSRRVLVDSRISIFRDIFSQYELLAYLSYRIPKLGYRCLELPTSRIYPIGEVPTKINGIAGNINLLKVLLYACIGKYNPK